MQRGTGLGQVTWSGLSQPIIVLPPPDMLEHAERTIAERLQVSRLPSVAARTGACSAAQSRGMGRGAWGVVEACDQECLPHVSLFPFRDRAGKKSMIPPVVPQSS
jgi:hypothetical protein